MKRIRKTVLSLILVVCLAMSLCPAAFAGESYMVDVPVTFYQTSARSMLSLINDFRTGDEAYYNNQDDSGTVSLVGQLSELKYSSSLEQMAMQRATEIALSFSHTRPNGQSCFTAYYGSLPSMGENIAAGQTSVSSVFSSWREDNLSYAGQGHRRNMLSKSFNAVGIGCVAYQGTMFWVQEFGRIDEGSGEPTDGSYLVSVEVAEGTISSFESVVPSAEMLALKPGASAALPTVTA